MASVFDGFDASLSEAVMEVFGETEAAVIRPRVSAQYTERGADIDRTASPVLGIFSEGPSGGDIKGQSAGSFTGTTRLATMRPEFWIPASAAAGLPAPVGVGDLIEFPSRAGAPAFAVVAVQTTDGGDVNLILALEDQAP